MCIYIGSGYNQMSSSTSRHISYIKNFELSNQKLSQLLPLSTCALCCQFSELKNAFIAETQLTSDSNAFGNERIIIEGISFIKKLFEQFRTRPLHRELTGRVRRAALYFLTLIPLPCANDAYIAYYYPAQPSGWRNHKAQLFCQNKCLMQIEPKKSM